MMLVLHGLLFELPRDIWGILPEYRGLCCSIKAFFFSLFNGILREAISLIDILHSGYMWSSVSHCLRALLTTSPLSLINLRLAWHSGALNQDSFFLIREETKPNTRHIYAAVGTTLQVASASWPLSGTSYTLLVVWRRHNNNKRNKPNFGYPWK